MKKNIVRFAQKPARKKIGLLSRGEGKSSLREKSNPKSYGSPYLTTNCKRTVAILADRYQQLFEKEVVKATRDKWYYTLINWVMKQHKQTDKQIKLSQEILKVMEWCASEPTVTNKKYPTFRTMQQFLNLWDILNAGYFEKRRQTKFTLQHQHSFLYNIAIEHGMTKETAGLMTEFCEILKSDINKWIDRPKVHKEHLGGNRYRLTTAKDSHIIQLVQEFHNTISYSDMVRECSRLLVAYPKWTWIDCIRRFIEDMVGSESIRCLIDYGVIRFDIFGRKLYIDD